MAKKTDPITLSTPIKRGEKEVKEVLLRKPDSGELRGLTLTDILQLDVNTLHKLLPRITDPGLTEPEVAKMDPADLVKLGTGAAGFFITEEA